MDLTVKMNDYETQCIQLGIPYLKLNTLSIMSVYSYGKLFTTLKKSKEWDFIRIDSDYGFEVYYPSRVAWRKLRRQGKLLDVLVYGAGAIKNFTIHPLKGNISPIPSEDYLVDENTVLAVRTGEITKSGIVPTGFKKLIKMSYGTKDVAFTEDLIRIKHNNEDTRLYTILFLNTELGKHISKIAYYGALQPHLDENILKSIPIPIPNDFNKIKDILTKFSNALTCEIRAWEAYFKAMKIVEEYLPPTILEKTTTSVASFKDFKNYGRLDSKFYLGLTMLEKVAKGNVIPANKLFNVVLGTAPRSREYKNREEGLPYISYESIDDSGYTDDNLFYRVPKSNSRAKAKRGSVIITTVAHSIEGIGKVGILYPHDDVLAMTGLAILNPKLKDERNEELCFYTFGVLKSSLMRKFLQSLTYGLTAQIAKPDVERIPIPVINEIFSDVAKNMRNFIENIHKANKIKRETIKMLEAELNRALYGDKNDESRR